MGCESFGFLSENLQEKEYKKLYAPYAIITARRVAVLKGDFGRKKGKEGRQKNIREVYDFG